MDRKAAIAHFLASVIIISWNVVTSNPVYYFSPNSLSYSDIYGTTNSAVGYGIAGGYQGKKYIQFDGGNSLQDYGHGNGFYSGNNLYTSSNLYTGTKGYNYAYQNYNFGGADQVGRTRIQVYRGPNQKYGHTEYAPWGYYVTQPKEDERKHYHTTINI